MAKSKQRKRHSMIGLLTVGDKMEDKALIGLLRDMLNYKKKEARFLFIALIVVICMNLVEVGAFLWFEAHMNTTTTTTTQTVDGEQNDIVNGDQYNDESQNRSN